MANFQISSGGGVYGTSLNINNVASISSGGVAKAQSFVNPNGLSSQSLMADGTMQHMSYQYVDSFSTSCSASNGISGTIYAIRYKHVTRILTSSTVRTNYSVKLVLNLSTAMANYNTLIYTLPSAYRPCFAYGTSSTGFNATANIMIPMRVGLGGGSNEDIEVRIYTTGEIRIRSNSNFDSDNFQINTDYLILNTNQGLDGSSPIT